MNALETRLLRLEGLLQQLTAQVSSLASQAAQLAQAASVPALSWGGGDSSAATVYVCVTGSDLAAAGAPASGAPTSITGQTVYSVGASAFGSAVTSATVVNGLPADVPSGSSVLLVKNGDGDYIVIAVACSGS